MWLLPPYTLGKRCGDHNWKEIILNGGEQSLGPCLAKKSEAVGTSCADCVAMAGGLEVWYPSSVCLRPQSRSLGTWDFGQCSACSPLT